MPVDGQGALFGAVIEIDAGKATDGEDVGSGQRQQDAE
jgi:hypothetical protein